MSNIKQTIDDNIYQNGQGLIRGDILNNVLKAMVDDSDQKDLEHERDIEDLKTKTEFIEREDNKTIIDDDVLISSLEVPLSSGEHANVGVMLSDHSEKLTELDVILRGSLIQINLSNDDFTQAGYASTSGFKSYGTYKCTEFVDISGATSIEIANVYANQFGVLGYSIYSEDKTTALLYNETPSSGDWFSYSINEIPDGAKWLLCTRLATSPRITTIEINKVRQGLVQDVEDLKNKPQQESVGISRNFTEDDVAYINDGYSVSDNSISKTNASIRSIIYFKENVKAIEFEVGSLLDANALSVVFGHGIDGNNHDCIAYAWLPSNLRSETTASVRNVTIDSTFTISDEQTLSIDGVGRMVAPYRSPENPIGKYKSGDICRIEIIGKFIIGSIKTDDGWKKWFTCDTDGLWLGGSSRLGWNRGVCIGFAVRFSSTNAGVIANNIKVINDANSPMISFAYDSMNGLNGKKRKWLAIGDSITAINGNNGLSYVGFASRKFNLVPINKGLGGWTLYRYWRDRNGWYKKSDGTISHESGSGEFHEGNGWQDAISQLPSGSVVSILMGTNDFDTGFAIPPTDAAMDTYPDPHPRFGTTDPTSDDAKDVHTTLGCLRLIIERIYELNKNVRIVLFSPFFRSLKTIAQGEYTEPINSEGRSIYDYADAIANVGKEYNIPTFNTCRDCGINRFTLDAFTYDNLHINEEGGELIGSYVGSKLRDL